MYYCKQCDNIFFSPVYIDEPETFFWMEGKPIMHNYLPICPECGSANFEEAPCCDSCATEYPPADLVDGLCPDCRMALELSGSPEQGS